jgi:hypothetical protein
VGTIDLLAFEQDQDQGVVDELVGETLRSARNKGCVVVEAVGVDDERGLDALTRYDFHPDEARTVWTSARRASPHAEADIASSRR